MANNTDSKLAKSFYEKSKQARSNLDKAQELYNARAGQEGKALYKTGEIATEILTDPLTYWMPFMKAPTFAARGAGYALTGGAEGALHEYGSNEKASAEDIAKMAGLGAALGLGGGALIEGAIKGGGALYSKFKNRGAGANTEPNSAPNTQNSNTAPNSAPSTPNSNADDLATNGIWLDYGSTPPPNGAASQKIGEVPLNITAIENLKTRQNELNDEIKSANELLKKARTNKTRKRLKEQIKSANDELKTINLELQKPVTSDQSAGIRGFDDDGLVRGSGFATDPNSAKAMSANEIAANEAEILGSSKPWSAQKGELVPVNANDDIIDLVPDENGVYGVAYNGSSKELAKIATEIAKGQIQSLGAKRLVYIADNLAETAAKDAEQKISANIAKIDDDSVELYANNTALLADIAKKYPMLNKDEQIELANKQILANASAELLEYSKFLNGGKLPNDARLLGKNAGRMILKSLNAGASKQEIIDMLLKAGISSRNSTAAKALIQTGDINAYNAQMRQGEAELIAELSQNVRVAAKNESLGAILGSAKEKAIKNDELLKKGVGNQGLDDVINTFKSSKSGKEFEVAENGFGRELLSYDGQVANEEMKRSFLAWEAQEKKADITLHDGRKVVFLEPDEAVELSYGNTYLYGHKSYEELMATKMAESLEQKFNRLKTHPAYENLLKMRENTLARELKGEKVGGSRPTVYYEQQSGRYLRTGGGGGIDNPERDIRISKSDVAKLRAGKADEVLSTKLENNLEALTGDPAASGLIDDLLTRDYHLASAAKKTELVAPKNADEVAGNSRTPSDETVKTAENAKTQKSIYEKYDEFNKLSDAEQTKKYKEMSPAEKAEFHAIRLRDNTHGYEVINRINYNKGWGGGSVRAIQNDKSIIPRMMTLNRIKTKKQATEILEGQRKIIEEKGNITPIKEFGTNYAEFYHAGGDAVKKLLAEKQGQVAGAFYDERFGDVGIVWGVEGTAKSDGWGIAKIAKYHPEALEKMEEMLKMPIIAQSENRIKLSDGKYFMSIRKDFNGEKQNWVLTAFEKEESKSVSGRRTNLSATQSASEKTTSQNTHTKNSSKDEIKSQEQKRAGLKRGFSTQALNELMLGLGSGGANAMAEDDPNKKAEAFIKGFLAGFGGAKAASMLVKNAPKLAPQLARASEKMASDLPRLLNDRPDILGGVLGRMNNAKDKFSFIFGGEKALGANKAKLKTARDMAKNGADESEIWAKTGWYKDIDGKWKFEINAEGGKLKELNAPELDEATKIIKRDYFDKQMNLKELEDFIQFKNGYIDFDAIKKFYDLPKDMSKGELTQKFPYFKMSVNDYMEHGFYKDIDLLHDEIMPARKILNQEYSKTPLNEVLDDPELFASYPQLKDVKVSVDELKSTEQAHFNPNKNEIVLSSRLDTEEMKSSLYHELQHKVQEIEGFGAGGNTQKLSYQEYKNLAGESEARNVEKRLNRTYSKDDAIDGEFNRLLIKDMDNPKWQELKQKRRELILAGKLDKADKIKKQLDQRQEFLKTEAVKNVERFSSYSPHPFNTLDINPNDRIVKYDSGMSASMELEKDLLTSQGRVITNALLKNASKMPKALSRDEFEAQFNANISGDSYVKTPIGDIKVNVEKAWEHFKKNTYNQDRSDLSGAFIHTLQDPLFIVKQNWKPTASPHTMGQSIAKSQNAKRLMDDRQREIITQSTIFFKPFSDENGGKYLASFAIDKNGELIQKTFYDIDSLEKIKKMIRTPENNVLYYKNARNQTMGYKDAEAGMRESFSPELKASYDMRDKLLKSTNEVRASLSKKGKAELEKLADSKDSKLSRDAQIMKTLENAKSNPARYERLKKLYLDENGKVKDSIGLC